MWSVSVSSKVKCAQWSGRSGHQVKSKGAIDNRSVGNTNCPLSASLPLLPIDQVFAVITHCTAVIADRIHHDDDNVDAADQCWWTSLDWTSLHTGHQLIIIVIIIITISCSSSIGDVVSVVVVVVVVLVIEATVYHCLNWMRWWRWWWHYHWPHIDDTAAAVVAEWWSGETLCFVSIKLLEGSSCWNDTLQSKIACLNWKKQKKKQENSYCFFNWVHTTAWMCRRVCVCDNVKKSIIWTWSPDIVDIGRRQRQGDFKGLFQLNRVQFPPNTKLNSRFSILYLLLDDSADAANAAACWL